MYRRSEITSGVVRFPVNNKRYTNTKEGGMFVKLVVLPTKDLSEDSLSVCCGTINTYEILGESLINDDHNHLHVDRKGETMEEMELEDMERKTRESKYFPFLHENEKKVESFLEKYISTPYLASILLGSTGWSGWESTKEQYWYCTHGDLTPDGKALYDQIKKLYKGHEVRLLTYLDT